MNRKALGATFQQITNVVCLMFQEYMKEIIALAPSEHLMWLEQTAQGIKIDCQALANEQSINSMQKKYTKIWSDYLPVLKKWFADLASDNELLLALLFELDEFEQEANCDLAALEAVLQANSKHEYYWDLVARIVSLFQAYEITNNYSVRLHKLFATKNYAEINFYFEDEFACYRLENDFAEEEIILAIINYVEVCTLYYSTYEKLLTSSE